MPRSRINWKRHSSRRSPKKNRCTAYAPDKWSIRQVLNHVTDTERAFAFRALSFARGLESPLPSYDQNIAASGAEADQVSWAAHVEEFRRVRLSTISLFRNMPSQAWARSGIARRQSLHRACPGLHHPRTLCPPRLGAAPAIFVGIFSQCRGLSRLSKRSGKLGSQ